jgi:uncharacterized pyridoxal phosphate-containing UPF0001 family protein
LILEKAGVAPSDVVAIVKFVWEQCPHLEFAGLMTIGSADASHSAQEQQNNPDFEVRLCILSLTTDIKRHKRETVKRDTRIGTDRIKHGHER